jgi:hypothetical protein
MSEKNAENKLTDKALADAGFIVIPKEAAPEKTIIKNPSKKIVSKPFVSTPAPFEVVKPAKLKTSDLIEVKVVVGTLHFEQGTFEHGSLLRVTREQALRFGKNVEIIEL